MGIAAYDSSKEKINSLPSFESFCSPCWPSSEGSTEGSGIDVLQKGQSTQLHDKLIPEPQCASISLYEKIPLKVKEDALKYSYVNKPVAIENKIREGKRKKVGSSRRVGGGK